jgi:glycosyltransferase involved in cell wall biosynthesis
MTKKLKVLLVSQWTGGLGGVETFLSGLKTELDKKGVAHSSVELAPIFQYLRGKAGRNNLPSLPKLFPFPGFRIYQTDDLLQSIFLKKKLERIAVREGATVVHAQGDFFGAWAPKPFLTTTHGSPLRVLANNPLRPDAFPGSKQLSLSIARELCRRSAERSDAVTVNNLTQKEDYLAEFETAHLEVVPHAVSRVNLRTTARDGNAPVRICSFARYDGIKRLDLLINWFARFLRENPEKPAELHLVGGGYAEPFLRRLTNSLGISKSVLFYQVRPEKVFETLSKMDFAVNLSLEAGLNFSALEAMAAGVPLLSVTDDCGCKGRAPVTKIGNYGDFSKAILNTIKNPAKKAREHTRKFHSWDKIVKRYITLYEELSG